MTSAEIIYPRVHHSLLEKHEKQDVTIVGYLKEGGRVELPEGKFIQLKDSVPEDLLNKAVEFRGQLLNKGSLKHVNYTDFGKDFDMDLYYLTLKTLADTQNLFGL